MRVFGAKYNGGVTLTFSQDYPFRIRTGKRANNLPELVSAFEALAAQCWGAAGNVQPFDRSQLYDLALLSQRVAVMAGIKCNKVTEARALSSAGRALIELGFFAAGADFRLRASEMFLALGERKKCAVEANYAAGAYFRAGLIDQGKELTARAVEIFKGNESFKEVAQCLAYGGENLLKAGRIREGREYFYQASEVFRNILKDFRGEAVCFCDCASRLNKEGEKKAAGIVSACAAGLFEKIGDIRRQAQELSFAGGYLIEAGEIEPGVVLRKRAAKLYLSLEDQESLRQAAQVYSYSARSLPKKGHEAISAELQMAAADIFECIGEEFEQAVCLYYTGRGLINTPKKGQGIKLLLKAEEIFTRRGLKKWLANTISFLGVYLIESGDIRAGVESRLRAAKIFAEIGDFLSQALELSHAGASLMAIKEFAEGAALRLQAADIFEMIGDKKEAGGNLYYAATALRDAKKYEEAAVCAVRGALLARERGDLNNCLSSLRVARSCYERAGMLEEEAQTDEYIRTVLGGT